MPEIVAPCYHKVPMQVLILNLKRHYLAAKAEIDAGLAEILESQRFIRGPQVKTLEDEVARYTGSEFAIGVASGTDALLLSLEALDLKPGDEVITTAFTFVATAETILHTGAVPVFIDIDPASFNLNPDKIKTALTRNTKGILPVHLFGLSADMSPILEIAQENGLWVLEDCAQAFGSAYQGKKVGGFGKSSAFSFFPSKNLGGFGDGGMVTTSDPQLAETVRTLSEHGGKNKYNVTMLGHNSRLDTLQAAILLAKLKYVDTWNENRRRIANIYQKELTGIPDLLLPAEPSGYYHTFNQFTIRTQKRDQMQKFLQDNGIGTAIYYPYPLHQQELFRRTSRVSNTLTETERAAKEVISLPIDPLLTGEEQDYVITKIKEFYVNVSF
ncbi:MAG: DegT/DnrJ/EryC1/StrS family aminotransferase [Candidatus Omnitrophota bacterium]